MMCMLVSHSIAAILAIVMLPKIACRRSRYEKKGVRDGVPFTGAGTKMLSFVRSGDTWRITSLLWQDDP